MSRPRRAADDPDAARRREAAQFAVTREVLGLSVEQFAAVLGTHLRTIFRWEGNERAIPPYLWLTLAEMLLDIDDRPRALNLPLSEEARDWLRKHWLRKHERRHRSPRGAT